MGKWDVLPERELGRTKGIVGEGEGRHLKIPKASLVDCP